MLSGVGVGGGGRRGMSSKVHRDVKVNSFQNRRQGAMTEKIHVKVNSFQNRRQGAMTEKIRE